MTILERRLEVIENVKESAQNGARLNKSCKCNFKLKSATLLNSNLPLYKIINYRLE